MADPSSVEAKRSCSALEQTSCSATESRSMVPRFLDASVIGEVDLKQSSAMNTTSKLLHIRRYPSTAIETWFRHQAPMTFHYGSSHQTLSSSVTASPLPYRTMLPPPRSASLRFTATPPQFPSPLSLSNSSATATTIGVSITATTTIHGSSVSDYGEISRDEFRIADNSIPKPERVLMLAMADLKAVEDCIFLHSQSDGYCFKKNDQVDLDLADLAASMFREIVLCSSKCDDAFSCHQIPWFFLLLLSPATVSLASSPPLESPHPPWTSLLCIPSPPDSSLPWVPLETPRKCHLCDRPQRLCRHRASPFLVERVDCGALTDYWPGLHWLV